MSSFEVPAGPPPGPEDEIAKRLRDMQIEGVRSSVASAQQQDPNRAAQALRLGLPSNAPQEVIDRLLQDQARVNTEREILQQQIAPQFWSDVDFAAIAADDPHIHKAEGFWELTGKSFAKGAQGFVRAVGQQTENLSALLSFPTSFPVYGDPQQFAQLQQQLQTERAKDLKPSPWATSFREFAEKSTESWAPTAGTFATDAYSSFIASSTQFVTLLPFRTFGILAGFAAISGAYAQQEAREAGLEYGESLLYSGAAAATETVWSVAPVMGVFGRAAARTSLVRNIAVTGIQEAITETGTEATQGLLRWKWLQADRSWEEVLPELAYSMAVAATAGGLGSAITTPAVHFFSARTESLDRQVGEAQAREQGIDGVSEITQQSPAVQRAPEVVAPFIDAVHEQAEVSEYRIDSAKFAELVDQAGGVDAVRSLVPDAVEQLVANKGEEGTEIVISPGEYQTKIGVDPKLAALFNEHVRAGDAEMSAAEAREVQATADEMVAELARQTEEQLERKKQAKQEESEIAEEIVASVLGPEPTTATPPLEGLQEDLAENAEVAADQAEQVEQQQAEITPEQQQLQEEVAVAEQAATELGEVPAADVLPTTTQDALDQAEQILTEVARQAGVDVGVVEEVAPAPEQPALPPEEIGFREWFGRSDAVDRAGEPLVLAPATLAKADQAPGITAFVEAPASESGVAVSLQKPMRVMGKQAQAFVSNPRVREKLLQEAQDKGFDGVIVNAKTKDANKRVQRQTFYVPVDQSQVRDFATQPRTADPQVLEAPSERAPGQVPPGIPQPRVTRDQIRGQAKLYSAMVARLAADYEMSPKEFWQVHGPRIVSASVGILTAEQQAAVGNTTGAYVPKNLEVILTTEQTEDTLIHELSHHYLHSLIELVRAGAPEGVNTKLSNLFGFLGVDSLAAWDALPVDQKVKLHEKFAYSFTEYLATGKAPSNKLRDLFASLRQWIVGFYTDVRAKLDADYYAKYGEHLPVLTPQVTAVFDSLLASDLAIERAKAADLATPLYQTRDQFQGTDQEWQDLQDLYEARDQQASEKLAARRLRDVVWTRNVLQKVAGRVAKRAKAARARITSEVEQELQAQPVYRALRFFRRGEVVANDGTVTTAEGPHRLSLAAVRRIFPNEDTKGLQQGRYRAFAQEGLEPDFIASEFGYKDGTALVRAVLDAKPFEQAVQEEVQRRMTDKHAELATPEAIQRQAAVELRSETHARTVATEYKGASGSTQPVGVMTQAAKNAAEQAIGTMNARDVKASRFERDERRFANMAVKAMMPSAKKGQPRKTVDDAAVSSAKRQQLLAVQMARVARKFEKELRGYRKLIGRLRQTSIREQVGDRGGDVITQLLSNINLETGQPAAVVPKQVSPTDAAAWVEERQEANWNINVDIAWIQSFRGTDYRDMKVEDLREFMRMLQEVVHVAKTEHAEVLLNRTETVREARGKLETSATQNATQDFSKQRMTSDWKGEAGNWLRSFWLDHITACTKMRVMDGGKPGDWFFTVWEPVMAAADAKDRRAKELGELFQQILAPLVAIRPNKTSYPEAARILGMDKVSGEDLFVLLLNMGNESNIDRVLKGASVNYGWTYQNIVDAVSYLPSDVIAAAQKVWDVFESLKPEIAELERRTKGHEPRWIEHKLQTIRGSDGKSVLLRGGYYPVVFDPIAAYEKLSTKEQKEADLLSARAARKSTTSQTYTKDRVEDIEPGRFVSMTLDGLFSGLDVIIHDLHFREWVINTNRILNGGGGSLVRALSNNYSQAWARDVNEFVDRIATNNYRQRERLDRFWYLVYRNTSVGALAGNLFTVAKQLTGLVLAIPKSGGRYTASAFNDILGSPIETFRFVFENSPEMSLRYITRYRSAWETLLDVRNKAPIRRRIAAFAYSLIQAVQSIPDTVTYMAAYKEALDNGHTEAESHRIAYSAVGETQGSGRLIDLSTVEADAGGLLKAVLPFYRIANTALNLYYSSSLRNPAKNKVQKAADFLIIFGAMSYLGNSMQDLLIQLIAPGDEEKEREHWTLSSQAQRFAGDTIESFLSSIAGVNLARNVGNAITGNEFIPYSGPMGLQAIGEPEKFLRQLDQALTEEDQWDKPLAKSAAKMAGIIFYPFPTVLVNRAIDAIDAYMDGDEDANPFMFLTGTGSRR